MTGKTHLNGGLLASLILCGDVVDGLLLMIGSMLPDIDHSGSTLGKSFPAISKIFSHRGFTHSLIFAGIIFLLNRWIAYGILVHMFLDMMTAKGIKLFWPIDWSVRFPLARFVKTNGKFEKFINWLMPIASIGVLVWRFLI